ncbi:MAG: hypothetical protein AAF705_13815 [Bacteroidota bacterium]
MQASLHKYRAKFLDDWYDFNSLGLFFFICFTYVVLLLIKQMFIIEGIAAFEVLTERGEMWIFDLFFGLQYLSVPVFLLWKWLWTTLLLWIGCFLFGYRLLFRQLWKLVMIAELLFFLPEFGKIIWFTLIETDPNYHDYTAFYPLSLLNLFDYTMLHQKWLYPLKSLNLFELLYWFVLAIGIYFLSGKKLLVSLYINASSYVLFYLIWIAFYLATYG